ncbi:MAG: hypothetical protein WCD16_14575 [Paracoccaceae bacterium]
MAHADANGKKDVAAEQLAKDVEAIKADLQHLTESLGAYGRARGERVRDAAAAEAGAMRDYGAEHYAMIQRQMEEMSGSTADMVRRNPAASLGIAAGLGFLVGVLTSRK